MEELIFARGFLEGYLFREKGGTGAVPNIPNIPGVAVTEKKVDLKPLIIYGTETGNSKKAATKLLSDLKKDKIQAKSVDIHQFSANKLEKETLVYFIISTQGDGELPMNAQGFYDELKAANVKLDKLNYAVFGLGDTSYPLFCNAGIMLDELIAEKGGKRLLPLVKADIDYNDLFNGWQHELHLAMKNFGAESAPKTPIATVSKPAATKKNYVGQISHKIVLNDTGSNKETYHIEISSDDDIQYVPGDALGVVPKNAEEDVHTILQLFDVNEAKKITLNGVEKTAQQWLKELNLKGLTKRTIDKIAELFGVAIALEKADLEDTLALIPELDKTRFEVLLQVLSPIIPRLYSISSSKEAHDGQVHLTVNLCKFNAAGKEKTGLASRYFADYPKDTDLDFYIHPNQHFRLPEDDKDIILIGPGTGIAPFRSFLAERDARGADGKNWLFFGEQYFVHDFYYQTEIQEWLSTGLLTKLSTAFSRDQQHKIYVQDRIKENGKLFNEWIESGAYIYICGQKDPMSKDVEQTILEVISQERRISIEDAAVVLEELEVSGRYLKDVY
ncbi:diflavin oxidoreductase [Polluticaenibacter yanchengensis]|uniref:Flavodoxin domain-containing protein n=1 Tax=Polluticaenibacter yanchengensis TaxID=3014562 RepID=A0ABT4UFU7_9BACT|nr:flavodoxin domain-containing protein [Chitinophagaceae bacterium LY-5]